jgi:hypothetical protein
MGKVTNAYKMFDVKPKSKRFLENIRYITKEIGVEFTDGIV